MSSILQSADCLSIPLSLHLDSQPRTHDFSSLSEPYPIFERASYRLFPIFSFKYVRQTFLVLSCAPVQLLVAFSYRRTRGNLPYIIASANPWTTMQALGDVSGDTLKFCFAHLINNANSEWRRLVRSHIV